MSVIFKTEDEKRKFLEIKDDDDEHIKSMKTELLMVMDMSPEEKAIFYQEKRVAEEEHRLQYILDDMQHDDNFIRYCSQKAKMYVEFYEETSEDNYLETAEQWADTAKLSKQHRYNISDIRKQREVIQWQKKKLNQMTSPSTEPSQS